MKKLFVVLLALTLAGCGGMQGIVGPTTEDDAAFAARVQKTIDDLDFSIDAANIVFKNLCDAKEISAATCSSVASAVKVWNSVYTIQQVAIYDFKTGAIDRPALLKALDEATKSYLLVKNQLDGNNQESALRMKRELKSRAVPPQCPPAK